MKCQFENLRGHQKAAFIYTFVYHSSHPIADLKEKGYFPDTIFDIGAHIGLWTIESLKVFPDANYYLFEAIAYSESALFPALQAHKREQIHVFSNVLLSDRDGLSFISFFRRMLNEYTSYASS